MKKPVSLINNFDKTERNEFIKKLHLLHQNTLPYLDIKNEDSSNYYNNNNIKKLFYNKINILIDKVNDDKNVTNNEFYDLLFNFLEFLEYLNKLYKDQFIQTNLNNKLKPNKIKHAYLENNKLNFYKNISKQTILTSILKCNYFDSSNKNLIINSKDIEILHLKNKINNLILSFNNYNYFSKQNFDELKKTYIIKILILFVIINAVLFILIFLLNNL